MPRRHIYLLGTEAPDNNDIPTSCASPGTGYDDRTRGHSIQWSTNQNQWAVVSGSTKDRAAFRAAEEYEKAVTAFGNGQLDAAAYYLGAMAHYIGDLSQYGHTYPDESKSRHSGYETWGAVRNILPAIQMESLYLERNTNTDYHDSVGVSINFAANEVADVLHRFFLNEVTN